VQLGEGLAETLLTASPRETPTPEDVSNWRAGAAVLLFLSVTFGLMIFIYWVNNVLFALFGAGLMLSFALPLALAVYTMRKIFLAVGAGALGCLALVTGMAIVVGLVGTDVSSAPLAIIVGAIMLVLAVRVTRWKGPVWGMR